MPASSQHFSVTPDFAVEAARMLDAGLISDALALCESGIAQYPEYATGYVVIANAYQRAGNPDAARSMAQLGLHHAPHSATLMKLIAIKKSSAAAVEEIQINDRETEELAQLAQSLEGARIGKLDTTVPMPPLDPPRIELIVTPTLAKIYEQQGLISEAVAAYRALAAKGGPETKRYQEKILWLESNPEFKK